MENQASKPEFSFIIITLHYIDFTCIALGTVLWKFWLLFLVVQHSSKAAELPVMPINEWVKIGSACKTSTSNPVFWLLCCGHIKATYNNTATEMLGYIYILEEEEFVGLAIPYSECEMQRLCQRIWTYPEQNKVFASKVSLATLVLWPTEAKGLRNDGLPFCML